MECMFFHMYVLIVCILICCGLCCRLRYFNTSGVWVLGMHGVDMRTINIHVPCCFYRWGVWLDPYKEHLNQLDLAGVIMSMYDEHRHICSFERVNLYSGWLRYGTRRVRYLPERVLPQFGFVQTAPDDLIGDQLPLCAPSWSYADRSGLGGCCYD